MNQLDWRPIAEAPKDGTPILLYGPYECTGRIYVGMWYRQSWALTTDEYNWIDAEPSHWMPLPEPPEGTS